MRKLMMAAAIALPMFGTAAIAQETVKIAYTVQVNGLAPADDGTDADLADLRR